MSKHWIGLRGPRPVVDTVLDRVAAREGGYELRVQCGLSDGSTQCAIWLDGEPYRDAVMPRGADASEFLLDWIGDHEF